MYKPSGTSSKWSAMSSKTESGPMLHNFFRKNRPKLNYQKNKFIEIISNSKSVLFVRWGAVSVHDAVELKSVLSEMIPGKFNILFLDPLAGLKGVNEIDWGIKGIFTVQVPSDGPNDDSMWDYVYNWTNLNKTYS